MSKIDYIENKYNCNIPATDVDLFVFLGNSLMNGYSTDYSTLHASVIAKYFTAGDQTHCRRWGIKGLTYSTPENLYNLFPYMNIAYNYQTANTRFGVDATMTDTMYRDQLWPRELFVFHYEATGTSIIAAETAPNWSASNTGQHYDIMVSYLKEAVDSLRLQGKNPRISVMFGGGGYVSTTDTQYRDEILGIVNSMRTDLEDSTIRFLWFKSYNYDVYFAAYRAGVDMVVAIDPLVETLDMDLFVDHIAGAGHPNSMGVLDQGFVCAGYWYEKYYSNRPIITSPSITGTLKVGQSIGFSYSYSGSTENQTTSSDTYRQLAGTYCHIFLSGYADGHDPTYYTSLGYGQTHTISGGTDAGKYLQARVFGRALSGAIHSFPIYGSWQGPIAA